MTDVKSRQTLPENINQEEFNRIKILHNKFTAVFLSVFPQNFPL